MKKFTIGYDPINKNYLVSNSPSGYFDGDVTRFKEDESLKKAIEEYLISNDANKRVIGLITEENSKGLEQIAELIEIIRTVNPKTVKLK